MGVLEGAERLSGTLIRASDEAEPPFRVYHAKTQKPVGLAQMNVKEINTVSTLFTVSPCKDC